MMREGTTFLSQRRLIPLDSPLDANQAPAPVIALQPRPNVLAYNHVVATRYGTKKLTLVTTAHVPPTSTSHSHPRRHPHRTPHAHHSTPTPTKRTTTNPATRSKTTGHKVNQHHIPRRQSAKRSSNPPFHSPTPTTAPTAAARPPPPPLL